MNFPRPDLAGPRAAPFQAPQGDLAILAGNANPLLAQNIANTLGVSLTPGRAHIFSEGNVFVRIKENVRGKDVFIIQGCHYPVNDNFMELLFWIDAARVPRTLPPSSRFSVTRRETRRTSLAFPSVPASARMRLRRQVPTAC